VREWKDWGHTIRYSAANGSLGSTDHIDAYPRHLIKAVGRFLTNGSRSGTYGGDPPMSERTLAGPQAEGGLISPRQMNYDMFMIPLTFDPPAWEPDHLQLRKVRRAYSVAWPLSGITLQSAKNENPHHADLLRRNPLLKFHHMFGYSIDRYHEFFVTSVEDYDEFRLGSARVSFGEVTPLAMFLFGAYYHRKAHGDEWGYLSTIRIENAPVDLVEAYLLNAMQVFGKHYYEPTVIQFEPVEWWEPAQPTPVPEVITSIAIDIEPLRLFHHGRRETEHESACLQFYRVLEFYAFFELQAEVSKLRNDTFLSDRQFLLRVSVLAFRNERTPIVRLVSRLAGKRMLARAMKVGLISKADSELLGNALYDFRNSFVHAKYDQRSLILAPSPLEENATIHEWRHVFQELARVAIAKLSKRAR